MPLPASQTMPATTWGGQGASRLLVTDPAAASCACYIAYQVTAHCRRAFSRREFKGPVTAVSGLEGYLLLASGNRIETCAVARCAQAESVELRGRVLAALNAAT